MADENNKKTVKGMAASGNSYHDQTDALRFMPLRLRYLRDRADT